MIYLPWVALHGMAHSFIEFDKAVIHVIRLVSFLWLWFSFSLSSDGEKEAYGNVLMGETNWGGYWVLLEWVGPCPVQLSSVSQSCLTLCHTMESSTPGLPVHHQLPKFTQTQVHWAAGAIEPSHLLFPPSLSASIFPSIRVFSNESVLRIRQPKYWSFSFNISPSNEYSWLISFRIDCLDLLAVQGTLKNLLQYHSSKASIPWCSAYFIVQI